MMPWVSPCNGCYESGKLSAIVAVTQVILKRKVNLDL